MSRELAMSQLTTELTDFLDLPDTLALPALHSIECKRTFRTPWRVEAYLTAPTDTERYEAISAWAAFAGTTVQVGRPYASSTRPSGMQRTLTARIVVAEVPIELAACVDGLFTAPLPPLTVDEQAAEDEIAAATQWGPVTA